MRKVEATFNKGYRVDGEGILYGLKGQVMSALPNGRGYLQFQVMVGAKRKNIAVHRLQAYQKFRSDMFQKGIEVRHLNGNKLDNSWVNIAIGTSSENKMDTPVEVRHASAVKGGKTRSPLSIVDILEMRRLYEEEGWMQAKLAEKFGVSQPAVSRIVRNETWCNI